MNDFLFLLFMLAFSGNVVTQTDKDDDLRSGTIGTTLS